MEVTSTIELTDEPKLVVSDRTGTGFRMRKNILVVDDNEIIRELLSVLLHEDGTVYTAINGLDALSKFAGRHFDVIVSDIEMPVMDGLELYKNVRPVCRDAFLFFSGTMNEDYLNYLLINDLEIFRKPYDVLKLKSAVQQKLQEPPQERGANVTSGDLNCV